ncbi:amidohydrolase family protein [Pseudonocardia sp. RS010]|uniref:amidohydrolase family protein n=1 Tax=Pseudonocardia sp. RS010 TaxID=3385979 RepID=UPI0039A03B00
MSLTTSSLAEAGPLGGWTGPTVDVDVHARFAGLRTIWGHLTPMWRDFITERGYPGPFSVDTVYPPNAPSTVATRWRRESGPQAGGELAVVTEDLLDAWPVQQAILNCYAGLDSVRHPDLAAAIARAVNDWLVAEWLERDPRLKASLVIPMHTYDDMVREIRRVGGHPGFVQVLLPVRSPALYGKRNWYPVYEAMLEHDLVAGLHHGGTSDGAPTPCGWPSWYIEERAGEQQIWMSQLTNIVAEGLFQKFPTLRMAALESGFTWVPSLMWRLDKEWKGLRRTVPWMRTAPSEVIRRHMRFSTAPIHAGPPAEMARIIDWLGPEMLMFASDYPHEHADDVAGLLAVLPTDRREDVMADNARTFYRLD